MSYSETYLFVRVGSIISQDLSMSIHVATNKLGNDTNLF
jgi:hypothetical protein